MDQMNNNSSVQNTVNNTTFASSSSQSSPAGTTPSPRSSEKRLFSSLGETIKFAVLVLIIVVPIRVFVAKPFIVNGASMDPTFHSGEYLVIDQLTYYFKKPARGDVVVFKYPIDPDKYFIKRIIGLPGEKVSINRGKVTIYNAEHPKGFTLDEPYLTHRSEESSEETLGNQEYFVMGDNRPASSDSRIWGPLSSGYITGRPIVRLMPFGSLSVWPGQSDEPSAPAE